MNDPSSELDTRLRQLGERLSAQPSVTNRVMHELAAAEPPQVSKFNQRRALSMLFKPRSLVVAAAVLALVVFGLAPWNVDRGPAASSWWLAPPSAWAGQLHAALEEATGQQFSCREQFINQLTDGSAATSSTTSTLFVAGNRYRRDTYDAGHLRESQWYEQTPDGLTMTAVHHADNSYTVTHDPKARQTAGEPVARLRELARRLDESGQRVGTARIEGRDAIEFSIDASKLRPAADQATMHVWLDQDTRMPLKITYRFAAPGALGQVSATTLVQDHFQWNPTLPANTFVPQIPQGATKVGGE